MRKKVALACVLLAGRWLSRRPAGPAEQQRRGAGAAGKSSRQPSPAGTTAPPEEYGFWRPWEPEPLRIAVCAASKSKPSWRSLADTALSTLLIPSLNRTTLGEPYIFTLYLAFDHDDTFWKKHVGKLGGGEIPIKHNFYTSPAHKIPFNKLTAHAYNDGADYIVRINDDTEFTTDGWATLGVEALAGFEPPNVGVVGPTFKEGNTAILTHDMVHRTHLDIFKYYYPPVFSAWWIDDWITRVYEPGRMRKLDKWHVAHHITKHGTRYAVQHHESKNLKAEIERGRKVLREWVGAAPKLWIEQLPAKCHFPDRKEPKATTAVVPKVPPDILKKIGMSKHTGYNNFAHAMIFNRSKIDNALVTGGHTAQLGRLAEFKSVWINGDGWIVSPPLQAYRNGGCASVANWKAPINPPEYKRVISITERWGSATWHFPMEAFVGLLSLKAHSAWAPWLQDPAVYIHVSAKTPWTLAWLELLHITKERVISGEIFAHHVLVPEMGRCGTPSRAHILGMRTLTQQVTARGEDVIIVRRHGEREIRNHNELESAVRKWATKGNMTVAVHDPTSRDSLRAQIATFRRAKYIFGPHGAGLLFQIAALPNAVVVEFMPPNANLCFLRMAYLLGHRYIMKELVDGRVNVASALAEVSVFISPIILTKNRPKSLQRLLKSLGRAPTDIRIDGADRETQRVAAGAFTLTNAGGLREAWLGAWPTPRGHAIILEDDVELSPGWYEWLQAAWRAYGGRTDLAGISLQRQTLVPMKPSRHKTIVNGHMPFLYKLPGSIGFSPHPKRWAEFLRWVETKDLDTFDAHVNGLVTSDWYGTLNKKSIWTQLFIRFCEERGLYTLYVTLPKSQTLAAHWREKGEHFGGGQGKDFELATTVKKNFPADPVKYGWNGTPDNVVILQLLNEGYVEMTKSWICNVRQFGTVLPRTLFVTTDQPAYDALREFDPTLRVVLKPYAAPKSMEYGEMTYWNYMGFRNDLLITMLSSGEEILLAEADAIWFADPVPAVLATQGDVVFMSDGKPPAKIVQGGFRLFRPTDGTKALLEDMKKQYTQMLKKYAASVNVMDAASDQLLMGRILGNLKVGWLDPKAFVPGLWYQDAAYRSTAKTPTVLLNNYIIGNNEKIKRAKQWKHWFLTDGACTSGAPRRPAPLR